MTQQKAPERTDCNIIAKNLSDSSHLKSGFEGKVEGERMG